MKNKILRHDDIREVLRRWLYDCTLRQGWISFGFEVVGRNIYIYTDKPGILIGRGGERVNDLTNRLKPYKIKQVRFVEIGTTLNLREVAVKRRRWF